MPSAHFSPPHNVGYVDLPEGVRLFTPLGGGPGASYQIGQEMVLEFKHLWTDEEEKQVIAYQFSPL